MGHDAAPREGGCRCGRVRFRISDPPLLTMASTLPEEYARRAAAPAAR